MPLRTTLLLLITLCVSVAVAEENPPVTLDHSNGSIVMDNGIVRLTLDSSRGEIRSIKYIHNGRVIELSNGRDAMYMDFNGGPDVIPPELAGRQPRAGYGRPMIGANCTVLDSGPEMAEVAFTSKPSTWIPFAIETHWALRRGQSGFYAWIIYRHDKGMPGGVIGQTRFVIKGLPGTDLFTHWIVDDVRKGPYKTGKVAQIVQDATVRFEDGTVFTKYDNSAFTHEFLVHGMAGHGIGVWMCWPSVEFCNGGPLRQDLTVHGDNVLLAMLQSGHYGAGPVHVATDEIWTRFYGPVFVYINHGESVEVMYTDAKRQAGEERAAWPYQWLAHPEYPIRRGGVRGQIRLADGSSAAEAWVVLGPNHEQQDWALSAKGYMFFTKTDADGAFVIEKVRPGVYTLWVSGADQFVDFRMDDVEVKADQMTDLQTLIWTPIRHGRLLWQIGTADRGTGEFMDGNNPRNYDTFLNYFKAFPDDVNFIIGKSDPKKDWYFAQWSWYSRQPQWTIQFDLDRQPNGTATLTLGMASVQPAGQLVIKVNDRPVESPSLPAKTGGAAYRSASQDSQYTLRVIRFDASLLKIGRNQITLEMSGSRKFPDAGELARLKRPRGAIMYDAIRLEVEDDR